MKNRGVELSINLLIVSAIGLLILVILAVLIVSNNSSSVVEDNSSVTYNITHNIFNGSVTVGAGDNRWILSCDSFSLLYYNLSFLPQPFECQIPCIDSQCVTYTGTCFRNLTTCNNTLDGLNCVDSYLVGVGSGEGDNVYIFNWRNPAPVLVYYSIDCMILEGDLL